MHVVLVIALLVHMHKQLLLLLGNETLLAELQYMTGMSLASLKKPRGI